MTAFKDYQKFVDNVAKRNFSPYTRRFQELAGLRKRDVYNETYLIEVSFDFGPLEEYYDIKQFKKTKNRYYFHSELTNPPVKAHYHIISNKGNQEIYAVNVDGTAHHRVNKGFEVPKKEADELRRLGVHIKADNIIEYLDDLKGDHKQLLTESIARDCISVYIEIEK